MRIPSLQLLSIAALPSTVAAGKPCRVLALSGGGDKGAYEAGVVYGLVNNLPEGETSWDVVTGISAGAINGGAIVSFPLGEEKKMADFLLHTAQNIEAKDVFASWSPLSRFLGMFDPAGLLYGFTKKSGLFHTQPLWDYMKKVISSRGGVAKDRKFVVGATSYNSGQLVTWNETSTIDDIVTGIKASASIPGIFETTSPTTGTGAGQVFGDGGVKQGVNVIDGIARCLEADPLTGETSLKQEDVVVDVILTDGKSIKPVVDMSDHVLTVIMRALSINRFKSSQDRVLEAQRMFPKVNFRYVVWPSMVLPGNTGLDFKKKDLTAMTKIGMNDAILAIKDNTGSAAVQKLKLASFEEVEFVESSSEVPVEPVEAGVEINTGKKSENVDTVYV